MIIQYYFPLKIIGFYQSQWLGHKKIWGHGQGQTAAKTKKNYPICYNNDIICLGRHLFLWANEAYFILIFLKKNHRNVQYFFSKLKNRTVLHGLNIKNGGCTCTYIYIYIYVEGAVI